MKKLLIALSLAGLCGLAVAETPQQILSGLQAEAKQADPSFAGFSADRGKEFYNTKHGKEWACASCHTTDPTKEGKHAATGRAIKPIAPSANAERFTDPEKVARLYKRMCGEVLGRECTVQEKGDFLTYLLSVK
ncbi:DUF1924 domain-containing protein [Uliginosibacterium sp. sgz301328]|uniref:DUF1924 domain-containing protein n=1 Tax=Uliginosibacterium sp. sgz301328 TaxID=3243764 RepID=UPI00359E9C53